MKPDRKHIARPIADTHSNELADGYDLTSPDDELDDASDLDEADAELFDDANWEAFIADEDERDPLPDFGDFWIDDD